MAQTKNVPASIPAAKQSVPPANAESNQASVQELKVTGHMMSLPSGLFCFVNEPVPGSVKQNGMPGIRVSPPPAGAQNVEIAGFRPDGWLNADGDAALVRIRKGPAQVLVTIYQLPNQQESAPRLQVRQLLNGHDAPGTGNAVPTPPPMAQERVDVIAHIQGRGDVGTKFGEWLGKRGSNCWIE